MLTKIEYDTENEMFSLALDYVNQTNCPIFLTGKAGSGKTTFLKYVKEHTLKNCVVVAPTGVAAINAGGVTMHSLFQLPMKPFIASPKQEHVEDGHLMSKEMFLRGLRMSAEKQNLLRGTQLLIIDEVSMVRCDMLDCVDVVLQKIRRNYAPFGGLQVLYIGDTFQLPPVVTDEDKMVLQHYYDDYYFFNAQVFQRQAPRYIELKKIYRQTDARFVEVLNHLRTNDLRPEDFAFLNQRHLPHFQPAEGESYITLTTRNHEADLINEKELSKLNTKPCKIKGKLVGDFNIKNAPCAQELLLKEGAQVMFVRNDTNQPKRFYNGKLATVTKTTTDGVYVQCEGETQSFKVEPETWENIRYVLKPDGSIDSEILGTFTQLPLRLAWAITVHKSQGLTFDKAIIDIGASFEFGQVYVALSRCKTLEGMVLRSPIEEQRIFSNQKIESFAEQEQSAEHLSNELPVLKFEYSCQHIFSAFDFVGAMMQVSGQADKVSDFALPLQKQGKQILQVALQHLEALQDTAQKFEPQLKKLLQAAYQQQEEQALLDRLNAAVGYFCEQYVTHILTPLAEHYQLALTAKKAKDYLKEVREVYRELYNKYLQLRNLRYNEHACSSNAPLMAHLDPAMIDKAKGQKVPQSKEERVPTKDISLQLFLAGKSIETIAEERKLSPTTVQSHLAQAVREKKLSVTRFMSEDEANNLAQQIKTANFESLKEIKEHLGDEVSYFQIRLAQAWMELSEEKG